MQDLSLESTLGSRGYPNRLSKNPILWTLFTYASLIRKAAYNPLMPEDHGKAIREIPREPEIIELFKKLVGASPLLPH